MLGGVPFGDAFPIVRTGDVERLAAFYCDQLGFERGYRFPNDGPADFVVVTLGELSVGLARTDAGDDVGRMDLWLYTEDVDGEVARLRDNGARVVEAPVDREWGERVATVEGPDGNLIHVGTRASGPA